MFTPKPISRDSFDAALAKAAHYRLLNEPAEAVSISLDILATEPEHQGALTTGLLALTDQFGQGLGDRVTRALAILQRLEREYDRVYYHGIIVERRAKAILHRGAPGSGPIVYQGLREAMGFYEQAEGLREKGNDDPILRWNACARLIDERSDIREAEPEEAEHFLE